MTRAQPSRFLQRLNEARRRERSRRALRVLLALAPLALLTGAAVSPALDVDEIRVEGNRQLGTARLLELAGVERGAQLVTIDTDDVERRVGVVPVVRSVNVRREWPGTVVIEVVERQPAIGVTSAGRVSVYDAEGVEIGRGGSAPLNTPMLQVPTGSPTPDVVAASVLVVRSLPQSVRARVATLTATTVDDLTLTLRDGATVVWGSSDRSAEKARVLVALLQRPARRYDVRSPERPATSDVPG